ncbi:TetR-like C-terminal domain-containing protein [Pseudobacteriovorax antillogorgiicola]|uniref:DNA-binding transcriptional regulator, AcrR family n=1 Tax=Pseudobacteriovorax antillogorgiicola TaxID=1513793 RepID=A0A1Y6BH45_9BACT|nr:TetR-like C-terminal domain-containing protein [Pseudobacteriovorax antillogorgiicola]TCS55565.1 AcrR family transcriptional regulator [Pseudobacteriovorax antillogorgiicola]SMF10885.1 DNA-binding transcriptional regulator, AcrR family [Pseudobacteriovorax antillogorgiicola]
MNLTSFTDASPRGIFLLHALEDLTANGSKNLCPQRISRKSGIKNYFEDADDLRLALAEVGFQELEERMRAATPPTLPFEERLYQACKAYLEMVMESPALLQLMFGLKEQAHTRAPEPIREAGDAAFSVLEHMMKDAIAQDFLKTNDSRSAALATWSFIHGFSFLMIRSGKTIDDHPEELFEMYQKLHRLLSKGLISAKPN